LSISRIAISDLTFAYPGSYDTIFEQVSLTLDSGWKLGLIGRNGRGKTTLLRLLSGMHPYQGSISASVDFEYFPYAVPDETLPTLAVARESIAPFGAWEEEMARCLPQNSEPSLTRYGELLDEYIRHDGYTINELITKEISLLGVKPEALSRPYRTLSNGERTKILIAVLFLRRNAFLLIDEPTDHLDAEGRALLADYLKSKHSFILVSHDRDFLDEVVDHVLVINKKDIEVQKGNFSSWQQNRMQTDAFEKAENEKLEKQAEKLEASARRATGWSYKTEAGKHKPDVLDKGYIGHKSAKMMKRAKSIERRKTEALEQTRALLRNVEESEPLSLTVLPHHAKAILEASRLSIRYGEKALFPEISFSVLQGERVCLRGANGAGKTSLLRLIAGESIAHEGEIRMPGGLVVSRVVQDASFLTGGLRDYCQAEGIEESLFKTILRKLGFSREQFEKDMREFSSGQRKKVLLAASLCRPAHLFVWDEPLNFIDVLSRVQIEALLLRESPTLLFVEHDAAFCRNIATKTVFLGEQANFL